VSNIRLPSEGCQG